MHSFPFISVVYWRNIQTSVATVHQIADHSTSLNYRLCLFFCQFQHPLVWSMHIYAFQQDIAGLFIVTRAYLNRAIVQWLVGSDCLSQRNHGIERVRLTQSFMLGAVMCHAYRLNSRYICLDYQPIHLSNSYQLDIGEHFIQIWDFVALNCAFGPL